MGKRSYSPNVWANQPTTDKHSISADLGIDMTSAPWADPELSGELPRFCRLGEGQALEYKQAMPGQARDLAKEIAAFATSNDGLILLGVADNGTLVGLAGMADQKERDDVGKRIAGVCRDINPPVRPVLLWAIADEKIVLCIKVSKGREPLYYVDSRPYIRHASVSRPAEPGEVIDAVRTHLSSHESHAEGSAGTGFFSRLADVLAGTLRWGDTEAEMRSLKPWETSGCPSPSRVLRPCATWPPRNWLQRRG